MKMGLQFQDNISLTDTMRIFFSLSILTLFSGCFCFIPVFVSSPVMKGNTAYTVGKGRIEGRYGGEASFNPKAGMTGNEETGKINVSRVTDPEKFLSFQIVGDYTFGITGSTDIEAGILYTPVLSLGGRVGFKQRLIQLGDKAAISIYPRYSYNYAEDTYYSSFPGIFVTTSTEDTTDDYYEMKTFSVPLIITIQLSQGKYLSFGPEITFLGFHFHFEHWEQERDPNGNIVESTRVSGERTVNYLMPGVFFNYSLETPAGIFIYEISWLWINNQTDGTWDNMVFPGFSYRFGRRNYAPWLTQAEEKEAPPQNESSPPVNPDTSGMPITTP